MSNPDWYPKALADRIPWHTNFNAQAVATGVARGLTAAQVAQITADLAFVTLLVNQVKAVDGYAQAVTAYKNAILDGPIGASVPAIPTVPAAIVVPAGGLPSVQARTRQYAGIIKAQPTYNASIGELYGIIAPAAGPLADPAVQAAIPQPGSPHVVLNLFKGGYDLIAVDMRRGGGDWAQIGVSQIATYVDTTLPLVAGQPELRDYRVQGMLRNARVGGVSLTMSAVTLA